MFEDTLWITNSFGEKLEALLRKPEGTGSFPGVVFVSGLGMTMHEWNNSFDEISQVLVKEGYITLQFSFSGCGASEGDYKEMTFDRQAKQIEDVINFFIKREDINKKRVGLVAQSCGVPSVLLADLAGIQSAVFISGAFNPYQNLKKTFQERHAYHPTGISFLPRSNGEKTTVGPEFWKILEKFDETKLINKIQIPVFIVHGDKDDKIPLSDAEHAYALLKDERKKLKVFTGGDHGIVGVPREMREEFLRDIKNWFFATL